MTPTDPKSRLVFPVAFSILLAWFVTLGYAVLAGAYFPLTVTTPLVMVLSGYVFGVRVIRTAFGTPEGGES